MTTPRDVLNVARHHLGVQESPSNSNRQKFGEWYGMNGEPWCAMFVSYCFAKAGMPLPKIQDSKGFAYCPYGVDYFKQIERLDKSPKVGDIVFYDFNHDGISEHVGILEEILDNGKIVTIEGNTGYQNNSNGGEVMRRTRAISSVQGFAHPQYMLGAQSEKAISPMPEWPGYIRLTFPRQHGESIRLWQGQMIDNGYTLGSAGADGVFGPQSSQALIQFQQDRGLEVDGVLGPISWREAWKIVD